jgi:hypothetical protein
MKKQHNLVTIIIILVAISSTYGQWNFRPIDPNNYSYRYGKSPYSGPPFLHFGTTAYEYYIASSQYSSYLTCVDAAFASWNGAGPVQFSRSTSGLPLTAQAQDYSNYGPAWSYPAWNGSTLELAPASSSIVLNTNCTWSSNSQNLNANPPVLDVQTMVVHEAGHINGLAHPLTNSYTHDATAPTMAGGDNAYFDNTLECRSLETNDVYGTQFLQLRVPSLYYDLQSAVNKNAEIGVGSAYIVSNYSLTGNINVPSGAMLTIVSGVTVTLNGYSLMATGGTITVQSGATISGASVYLKQGNDIKGWCPSLKPALDAAASGQTVQVFGAQTIDSYLTVSSGVTLMLNAGSTLQFNSSASRVLIYGALWVNGTSTSHVTVDGQGYSRSGYANALVLTASGGTADLQYTDFMNAPYELTTWSNSGNVSAQNCNFSNFGYASDSKAITINQSSATISIDNSTFTGSNSQGTAIFSSSTGTNVTISGNTITSAGTGIYAYSSDAFITSNTIHNNANYGINANNVSYMAQYRGNDIRSCGYGLALNC